jgi:hypothetical protein
MAQKRRPPQPNKRQVAARSTTTDSRRSQLAIVGPVQRAAPVVYGKAFIVAEDSAKKTFVFQGGAWTPYASTIAECRQTCLVKELPQKLNNMTRYEVRCPE